MSSEHIINVLLLEDDEDDYRLFVRLIREKKNLFRITWVERLADAVTELQNQEFDIILTDLSVPDSKGLETVSALRSESLQTPIIVLTSIDDDCIEKDILKAGAQDFLVKGEMGGRAVVRAMQHAVQRQQAVNKANELVVELESSQSKLHDQAVLLRKKNYHLQKLYNTAQEFVDNVSHEFRTPLTIIKDYVSLIREGMVGEINDEQQGMLDKVSVRADDLNNMVDDLLDVSKLEAGLLNAWRRSVATNDVINRIAPTLRQRAPVKNVLLEVNCDEDIPNGFCDADKLGRVVTNLTVNAIKFAGNNGTVRVWTKNDPKNDQIIIGVSDNGCEVEDSNLGKAFQSLQKLNRHGKSTVKGFGLGLSIAQQLCELNLGELNVETKFGAGNTFSFTIPVADPAVAIKRWLDFQTERRNTLQLFEIKVAPDAKPVSTDEFDNFLNCSLQGDDLLFRSNSHCWFLAMSSPDIESDVWFQRFSSDYAEQNKNRPLGPLPVYEINSYQNLAGSPNNETIVEKLLEIMQSESHDVVEV